MKFIQVLAFSIVFSGCITLNYDGLQDVIDKNIKIYKNNDSKFSNVAAILKEYTNNVKNQKFKNTKELKVFTKYFIIQIEKGNISKNYPVKANKSEIKSTKSIILDTISYIEGKNIPNYQYNTYIYQSLKIYIIEIINHENKILQ
jgi:hypothetical protein